MNRFINWLEKEQLLEKENYQLAIFYQRSQSSIYLISDKMDATPENPNVQIINIPTESGKFNIDMLHKELLTRNMCQVLIEAGGALNAAMMHAKAVDEVYTFVCPRILMDNAAINQFNSSQNQTMDNAVRLQFLESMTIGEDILLKHKVIH